MKTTVGPLQACDVVNGFSANQPKRERERVKGKREGEKGKRERERERQKV